jgi:hypothetical protein
MRHKCPAERKLKVTSHEPGFIHQCQRRRNGVARFLRGHRFKVISRVLFSIQLFFVGNIVTSSQDPKLNLSALDTVISVSHDRLHGFPCIRVYSNAAWGSCIMAHDA